jgi:hypothetical protein
MQNYLKKNGNFFVLNRKKYLLCNNFKNLFYILWGICVLWEIWKILKKQETAPSEMFASVVLQGVILSEMTPLGKIGSAVKPCVF